MKNATDLQEKTLQKIKSLVEQDNRILGLWAVGSMATGKADKYSDLDVYILIDKENYDEVYRERESFARKIGKVLSSFEVEWPNCQLYGVILDNFIEVDLCYCKPEQIEVFGPYKIIVDNRGDLTELLKKHTVKFETDIKKRLTEHLDFAAYNLLHAINMLGRGEYWSAIRQIEMLRKRIVSIIGLRTGADVEEEYRKLENIIDERENTQLQKTLCTYDVAEIAQAIENTAKLFIKEAEKLSRTLNTPFPSERFTRLLQYLDNIRMEKEKQPY